MRRSLSDLIAQADEMAERFENYEPDDGDLNAPLSPIMAVKLAQFRRSQAEKELAEAIRTAVGPPRRSCRLLRRARATRRSRSAR